MKQNKTIDRSTSWNRIDYFLARWRTSFLSPYLSEKKKVADIGCGKDAKLLFTISPKIKEGHGFDFNLENKFARDNITLYDSDFKDSHECYDVVCMFALLEHLPYPDEVQALLKNVFDRLNPGGYLVLTTPDKRSKKILEFLAYRLRVINEEEIRDHKHYFHKEELLQLMSQFNFSDISHRHFQCGLNNLVICKK